MPLKPLFAFYEELKIQDTRLKNQRIKLFSKEPIKRPMVLRGGRTINATPLLLQNRYGLSRRKFLNTALPADPDPQLLSLLTMQPEDALV